MKCRMIFVGINIKEILPLPKNLHGIYVIMNVFIAFACIKKKDVIKKSLVEIVQILDRGNLYLP